MTEIINPVEEFTEAYIKSINQGWSKGTDDNVITLVTGNLRTFSHKLAEFIESQNSIPLDVVWYGPHPCQMCDIDGKKGTMIVKAGNGADDSLEFNFVHDSQYPNHKWIRHAHIAQVQD